MEDGEIIDDEIDLDFGYVPLARPAELLNPDPRPPPAPYVESEPEEEESSSSDSDSDNGGNHRQTKKPKVKAVKPRPAPQPVVSRPKKYDIWCSGLQEEVLTRGLNSCDVAPDKRDRNVESYNYKIGRRSVSPEELAKKLEKSRGNQFSNKRSFDDSQRSDVKSRLGWRPQSFHQMDKKGTERILGNLSVTEESTNEQLAEQITTNLREQKGELILKIVEVLGKEKSMDLYTLTQNVEADGGMLIMNQTRRRTSGGVFLFHVRNSCNSEECMEIFEDNRREHERARREVRAQKRKEARKNQIQSSNNNTDAEAAGQNEDGELEDGELEMKTDVALSGEEEDPRAQVRNPPPSPVTDGRADSSPETADQRPHSTEELPARQVATYDDDLLDLHVDFNEMDDMETF